MPQAKSLFRVSGTLDNLTFYQRNGKYQVRRKSSLTGDRVRTEPAFAASRIRAHEYGGAATVAAHLRKGLGPLQHLFVRGRAHTAITAVMRQGLITQSRAAMPGGYSISRCAGALSGLILSASTKPANLYNASPRHAITTRGGARHITLTAPAAQLMGTDIPPGATHCAFVAVIQAVSDFRWDPKARRYVPVVGIQPEASLQIHRFPWQPMAASGTQADPVTFPIGKAKEGITHIIWWGVIFSSADARGHTALLTGTHLRVHHIVTAAGQDTTPPKPKSQEDLSPAEQQLLQLLGLAEIDKHNST